MTATEIMDMVVIGMMEDGKAQLKILLKDINYMPKLNDIYLSYFQKPLPIRTTFQAAGLPFNAAVEIEFTAHK